MAPLARLVLSAAWLFPAALMAAGPPVPAPPVLDARSYVVIDHYSGYEIAARNPGERLAPASLTKLMTAYTVFKALEDDELRLDEQVTVSENAWRTPGSRMFIDVGSRVSIEELLLGMIVQSGNDASVALAEHIAGTEAVFAEVMNRYAAQLGMTGSHFRNATGLPDEDHYATARDMATLASAIIADFPEYYRWYSVREFAYNGIAQNNRNSLLWRDESVDGMKTGHTDDAGYCLISSAYRDGMRIVAVVLGSDSAKSRMDGSQALLNYGFRFFETRLLFRADEEVARARIWKGEREYTPLGLPEDLWITVPRGSYEDLESVLNMPSVLLAPVARGQPLADLEVSLNGTPLVNEPLQALAANPSGSVWQRAVDSLQLWFE